MQPGGGRESKKEGEQEGKLGEEEMCLMEAPTYSSAVGNSKRTAGAKCAKPGTTMACVRQHAIVHLSVADGNGVFDVEVRRKQLELAQPGHVQEAHQHEHLRKRTG